MNERIDKLFAQAMDLAVPETWTTLDHAQLTKLKAKFAELIVQECIDELDGKILRAIDHEGDETWPDLILKEHFGVK